MARRRPRREAARDWRPRERKPKRRSLLPTAMWTLGAIVGAMPLVAVIYMALTQPPLGASKWAHVGVIGFMTVIEFCLIVMALHAFLNWKDPD